MSRASLLRRLEKLEASVTTAPVQRLAFVEVAALPDAERDAYWAGDASVIGRYADPDARTIIVDLNPAVRASWLETRDMTEEEREAHENALDRAEAAERAAATRPVNPVESTSENRPPALWGYDRFGQPIFDNDPRFRDGIGAVVSR